jgi:hypothetical protein
MRNELIISDVRFRTAKGAEVKSGLIRFASILINDCLRLDGISIRRTMAGRIAVMFPERLDGVGRRHRLIWPIDAPTRRRIERQSLEALAAEMKV